MVIIIVIYRKNETILILISSKRYFSHRKNKYLTLILLNFKGYCNFGPRRSSTCLSKITFLFLYLWLNQILTVETKSGFVFLRMVENVQ